MIAADQLDPQELVHSLGGTLCPACGRRKASAQTFCRRCYFALPSGLRRPLYDRLGNGYEQAVAAALDALGCETPRWRIAP